MEFIHTAQTMGMDRVTHEAKELAFRIKLRLAASTAKENPAADLVQVQHDLDLLLRLADLQATEYEVRDFAPRLNQFVALTKTLLSDGKKGFDETKIRRLISSSIDFYVMALMRNKPMIENTLNLLADTPSRPHTDTAVLVAGGFHTLQLTNMLREKNVSYIVISPTVESISDKDHELYVKRLNGDLLTPEEIFASLDTKPNTGSMLAKLWPFSKTPSPLAGEGLGEGKGLAAGSMETRSLSNGFGVPPLYSEHLRWGLMRAVIQVKFTKFMTSLFNSSIIFGPLWSFIPTAENSLRKP